MNLAARTAVQALARGQRLAPAIMTVKPSTRGQPVGAPTVFCSTPPYGLMTNGNKPQRKPAYMALLMVSHEVAC